MNRSTSWTPQADAASEPQGAEAAGALAHVIAQLRQFLELGAAQLDAAMRESNTRVDQLATTIGALKNDACALTALATRLEAAGGAASQPLHADIQRLALAIDGHAQTAITALQFYDKLIQRLTHVREGLAIPADSTAGAAQGQQPSWSKLLEQVRARYSTVEERVLFDFMMRGLSADQMLRALSQMRASVTTGDYEPF